MSDTPEDDTYKAFSTRLFQFQTQYSKPTTRGTAIANHAAIKKLYALSAGDAGMCEQLHRQLCAEDWRRGRVDWTTVHREFNNLKLIPPIITMETYRDPYTGRRIGEFGR